MSRTIQITLDDHDDEFVRRMVTERGYEDENDVLSTGLCLLEEEEKHADEPLHLTPKSCFETALTDTGISEKIIREEDWLSGKFFSAYQILERRMQKAGYITDECGDTHYREDSEKPSDIFSRTIKGFYHGALQDQIDAAWDLFIYHMERQGNLVKEHGEEELQFPDIHEINALCHKEKMHEGAAKKGF